MLKKCQIRLKIVEVEPNEKNLDANYASLQFATLFFFEIACDQLMNLIKFFSIDTQCPNSTPNTEN